MRKLTKKISMLMVLAMLVGLFSGVVSASAASKWSFKSGKYDVAVGGEINMKKSENGKQGEYADFDLLKEGKAPEGYTVTWESSNEDVVWVNAKTGQLRADKAKVAKDGDKAVITANIVNDTNKKTHAVSFTIVVGEVVAPDFKVTCADVTVNLGEAAKFSPEVTLDGEVVKFPVHKSYNVYFLDGKVIGNDWVADKAGVYNVTVAQFGSKAERDEADITKALRQDDFTVTVKSVAPEFVSAEQTALNKVEIVLNDAEWAKKLADNAALLNLTYLVGEVELASLIKSVALKDGAADTVVVTMFDNLTTDTTYKFAYIGHDDCVKTVVGAKTDVASIKVEQGSVPAGTNSDITVKFYNEKGVDITTPALTATLIFEVPESSDGVLIGNQIYFFEAGKSAVVTAKYDQGWDLNGNKLDELKSSATYSSVKPHVDSNLVGFALKTDINGSNTLTYSTSVELAQDEDDKYLHAKYVRTPANGQPADRFVVNGLDEVTPVTYWSTDERIVMIDASGKIKPCSVGTARIYVKNNNGGVIGSVTVTIKAARTLQYVTASITDRTLSTAIAADTTKIAVSAKNQYQQNYTVNGYKVEVVNPTGKTMASYFTGSYDNVAPDAQGNITLTLNESAAVTAIGGNNGQGKVDNVTLKVTALYGNNQSKAANSNVVVSIKNMTGVNAATTQLSVDKTTVDTKLNQADETSYNTTIKLVSKDGAQYETAYENFAFVTQTVTSNPWQIVILKDGTALAADVISAFVDSTANDKVILKSVIVSGSEIKKLAPGRYEIKLYKTVGDNVQYRESKFVTVSDNTSGITATVKSSTVAGATLTEDNIKASLEFKRDGKVINDFVTVLDFTDRVDNGGKSYLRTIKVKVNPNEMKSDNSFDEAEYFVETVTVNQLYSFSN